VQPHDALISPLHSTGGSPQKISPEQKKRLLKAKIAVALQDETGKVPSKEKIEEVFLLTRGMYKAVLGLHFKRKEQKKQRRLAIF
jgi:hypothetical protein